MLSKVSDHFVPPLFRRKIQIDDISWAVRSRKGLDCCSGFWIWFWHVVARRVAVLLVLSYWLLLMFVCLVVGCMFVFFLFSDLFFLFFDFLCLFFVCVSHYGQDVKWRLWWEGGLGAPGGPSAASRNWSTSGQLDANDSAIATAFVYSTQCGVVTFLRGYCISIRPGGTRVPVTVAIQDYRTTTECPCPENDATSTPCPMPSWATVGMAVSMGIGVSVLSSMAMAVINGYQYWILPVPPNGPSRREQIMLKIKIPKYLLEYGYQR